MNINFPFDPLKRAAEVESIVTQGDKRLYYRFRPAPYYGGIATADAVGCSFLCAYCWNYNRNLQPTRFGDFYTPQQVSSKLLNIARRKSFNMFRISGAEPILGENSFNHLIDVIDIIFQNKPHSVFILETNGFILGFRADLIEELKFKNLRIRICLKGIDNESFELITGARKDFFPYPFKALKELERLGINTWPALMGDLFSHDQILGLEKLLGDYEINTQLELESLEAYPFVLENMKRRRIKIFPFPTCL